MAFSGRVDLRDLAILSDRRNGLSSPTCRLNQWFYYLTIDRSDRLKNGTDSDGSIAKKSRYFGPT